MRNLLRVTLHCVVAFFVMMATALSANAQVVSVDNVKIKKGETVEVVVNITGATEAKAAGMIVNLPQTGFTFAYDEEWESYCYNGSVFAKGHGISERLQDVNRLKLAILHQQNAFFAKDTGSLVSFRVTASDDVQVGDYTCTLTKVEFSPVGFVDDVQFVISVEEAAGPDVTPDPNPGDDSGSLMVDSCLSINDVTVKQGGEANVAINIVNASQYVATGMFVTLPSPGFSFVYDEEGETYTASGDVFARSHSLSEKLHSENSLKLAILSLKNDRFAKDEGTLASFDIKVDESVEPGVYVGTISKCEFSRPSENNVLRMVDVKFYIVVEKGAVNMVIDDKSSSFSIDSATLCESITYNRTFNNTDWQALYVPFSMSYSDWSNDFEVAELNNVHEYDDNEDGVYDRTELEVLLVKSGSLEPNTPYLIRAKSTGDKSLVLADAYIYPTLQNSISCSSVKVLYKFTGTYDAISNTNLSDCYVMSGGALHPVASGTRLGAFRWYLQPQKRGFSSAYSTRRINIRVLGEEEDASAIAVIGAEDEAGKPAFNLAGQRVNAHAKGIIIRNGKKVFVK